MLASVHASAHTASDRYGIVWGTGTIGGIDQDRTVQWHFVDSVPNTARDVIRNGASEWGQISGTPMSFDFESGQSDFTDLNFDNCENLTAFWYQKDKVGWGSLDSSTLASTRVNCVFASNRERFHHFKIKFNSNQNWHMEGSSVPSAKYDLWSVSTHEFGHATGFVGSAPNLHNPHWAESGELCPGPNASNSSYRHTMCPGLFPGTGMQRDPAEHDRDTFQNAYD